MDVHSNLLPAKENAIPAKLLAARLGFKTVRDLQKQVERERAAGFVISTDAHGGGYYLPSTEREVTEFVKTLSNRAGNTYKALRSAQDFLDGQTGQEKMGGW